MSHDHEGPEELDEHNEPAEEQPPPSEEANLRFAMTPEGQLEGEFGIKGEHVIEGLGILACATGPALTLTAGGSTILTGTIAALQLAISGAIVYMLKRPRSQPS